MLPEGDEVRVPPIGEASVLELLELVLEDAVAAVGVLEDKAALAVDVGGRRLRVRRCRHGVVLRQRGRQQRAWVRGA